VDRLACTLKHRIGLVDEKHATGIDRHLHHPQAIKNATPAGKAMLQMCGVFAELETDPSITLACSRLRCGDNHINII